MSLFKRLLRSLGLYRDGKPSSEMHPLMQTIEDLAYQERRPTEAVAADLLELAREQRQANEFLHQCWESLTPREQQVAALVCMGYTNRQIADQLSISLSTVKTHVRNVLLKFGLRYRTDLQTALSNWNLDGWDQ